MTGYTHLSSISVQGAIDSLAQGRLIGSFSELPAPSTLNQGQIVLYTGATTSEYTKGKYYVSNGTAWVLSDASPSTVVVDSALSDSSTNPVQNKVIKAALDAKVPAVSGKGLSTNDYTTAEKAKVGNLPDNANTTFATKTELTNAVSSVYKYKGTKATYSALPTSGNTVGDVYNVEAAYGNVPAGTNYAWNGSAWDALGGTVTGFVKDTTTVNGKPLTSNVTLSASDVNAVPTARKVNNKALSADITLSAADVGALPAGGTAVKATADANGNNIVNTYATKTELTNGLAGKQASLVVGTNLDSTPTSGSTNPMTSGGAYTALATKQDKITVSTSDPTSSDGSDGDLWATVE